MRKATSRLITGMAQLFLCPASPHNALAPNRHFSAIPYGYNNETGFPENATNLKTIQHVDVNPSPTSYILS